MSWRIPLSDLRITPAQRAAVGEVLDSGWLSMGPWTATFEERFAAAAGVDHAVAVSNATSGLLLALQACGVGPRDEVVMPSLTFVADANVVCALGATPVFADVQSVTRPLVDPHSIRRAVTPRTRAVVVVDYAGYGVDLSPVADLRAEGVRIVEDAAHAAGPATDDGRWLPLAGDVAVYSFFANKNLPTGEGGMIATPDSALADRVRLLRGHGMTTGTWDRHRGHASEYDVVVVGGNHRPQELSAALGAVGLADLPGHNALRRRWLAAYRAGFADLDPSGKLVVPTFDEDEPSTGHIAVVALPPGRRPEVRAALASAGIQSSLHYPPIHRFTAYRNDSPPSLPVTEAAADRFVTLPLHPWLTDDHVAEVCGIVMGALRG